MSFSVGERVRCLGGNNLGTIRFVSVNGPNDTLYEVKFDEDIVVDLGGDEDSFSVPHISFRTASQIEKVKEDAKVSTRYKSKVAE